MHGFGGSCCKDVLVALSYDINAVVLIRDINHLGLGEQVRFSYSRQQHCVNISVSAYHRPNGGDICNAVPHHFSRNSCHSDHYFFGNSPTGGQLRREILPDSECDFP
mmetsp:Transcript_1987/g.3070  ORF Transcript_1987/g.3070 Transcript_1987/m.3070 type:complete len:107 (+) Transcript_1987:1905-2225(+)